MQLYGSKKQWVVLVGIGLLGLAGCTASNPSPDTIRRDTATATTQAARDTKAVAQGIFDGIRQMRPLNINTASRQALQALPGVDEAAAYRIVEGRPYKESSDLARRHILSQAEYDRIANKIKTQ